jgi:hypothetical protein
LVSYALQLRAEQVARRKAFAKPKRRFPTLRLRRLLPNVCAIAPVSRWCLSAAAGGALLGATILYRGEPVIVGRVIVGLVALLVISRLGPEKRFFDQLLAAVFRFFLLAMAISGGWNLIDGEGARGWPLVMLGGMCVFLILHDMRSNTPLFQLFTASAMSQEDVSSGVQTDREDDDHYAWKGLFGPHTGQSGFQSNGIWYDSMNHWDPLSSQYHIHHVCKGTFHDY